MIPKKIQIVTASGAALLAVLVGVSVTSPFAGAASAKVTPVKVGGVCKKAGLSSGQLVCTKKASRLVWARTTATTTVAGAVNPAPSPTTPGAAAAPTPVANDGIAGSWKATPDSVIGYRVKEVLDGQSVEAAGRTNAVTGTLTIEGTTAKSVQLSVDVTRLESDKAQRDKQVQGRILDTSKYPTAKLVLKNPIEIGKVPGDKEIVTLPAKVTSTIKAATRDVDVEIKARRNGANLEINGSIPIKWSDWGIESPSLPPFVSTEDNGILEFLVVFAR